MQPFRISRRRFGDLFLFAVTSAELILLFYLTPTFATEDCIYVAGHLLVLGIALTRPPPEQQDASWTSSIAVFVSITLPLCPSGVSPVAARQPAMAGGRACAHRFRGVLELRQPPQPGRGGSESGLPAGRLATSGPYRLMHAIRCILAYVLADIGFTTSVNII